MTPEPNQVCENCGKKSRIIIDSRVLQTEKWPKDHWVFLCPACHLRFGKGFGEDDIVIYTRIFGNLLEVRKEYKMDPETIKEFISGCRGDIERSDEWKLILTGEIAYHLSLQSQLIRAQNECIEAFVEEMRKNQRLEKEKTRWCKCGHPFHQDICTYEDCLCVVFTLKEEI